MLYYLFQNKFYCIPDVYFIRLWIYAVLESKSWNSDTRIILLHIRNADIFHTKYSLRQQMYFNKDKFIAVINRSSEFSIKILPKF